MTAAVDSIIGLFVLVFLAVLLVLVRMNRRDPRFGTVIPAPKFPLKGYKGFTNKNADFDGPPTMKCRHMDYEVGKTYEMKEDPFLCIRGFHFCLRLTDVFGYYRPNRYHVYCEVEATGKLSGMRDKWCTNRIRIVRLLQPGEIREIIGKEDPGNPWLDYIQPVTCRYRLNESQTRSGRQVRKMMKKKIRTRRC